MFRESMICTMTFRIQKYLRHLYRYIFKSKIFVLPVCVKTDMLSKDINLLFMQIGWNVFHKKQRKSVLYDCIKSLKNFTFFIMNVPSWDHLKMTDRYFTPLEICVWYDDMKNKRIGG